MVISILGEVFGEGVKIGGVIILFCGFGFGFGFRSGFWFGFRFGFGFGFGSGFGLIF